LRGLIGESGLFLWAPGGLYFNGKCRLPVHLSNAEETAPAGFGEAQGREVDCPISDLEPGKRRLLCGPWGMSKR
jgi:hypothetical protein